MTPNETGTTQTRWECQEDSTNQSGMMQIRWERWRRKWNHTDETGMARQEQSTYPRTWKWWCVFLELPSTVRDEEGPHLSSRKLLQPDTQYARQGMQLPGGEMWPCGLVISVQKGTNNHSLNSPRCPAGEKEGVRTFPDAKEGTRIR